MLDADPNLVVIDARLALDATAVLVRLRGARRAHRESGRVSQHSLPKAPGCCLSAPGASRIGGELRGEIAASRGIDAIAMTGGIERLARRQSNADRPHTEGEAK